MPHLNTKLNGLKKKKKKKEQSIHGSSNHHTIHLSVNQSVSRSLNQPNQSINQLIKPISHSNSRSKRSINAGLSYLCFLMGGVFWRCRHVQSQTVAMFSSLLPDWTVVTIKRPSFDRHARGLVIVPTPKGTLRQQAK